MPGVGRSLGVFVGVVALASCSVTHDTDELSNNNVAGEDASVTTGGGSGGSSVGDASFSGGAGGLAGSFGGVAGGGGVPSGGGVAGGGGFPSGGGTTGGGGISSGGTGACGNLNQPCCPTAPKCFSSTTACNENNNCVACGDLGETCCSAGNTCNAGDAKCCANCDASGGFHCGSCSGAFNPAGHCKNCCVVCVDGTKFNSVSVGPNQTCDSVGKDKCTGHGGINTNLNGWKNSCT